MIKFKVKFLCFLVFLSANVLKAQDFHGKAIYETKMNISDVSFGNDGMTDNMKQQMQEKLNKAFEKTYILDFDKQESVYYQEVKLQAPIPSSGIAIKVSSNDERRYKDVKQKIEVSEENIFGKEFLVQDSLPKWNWELKDETKKIGDYNCYKAISVIPVSEEDKQEYEKLKKTKSQEKTSFIMITAPKEKIITVWYTPEIPISQGPEKYWGLPGLILEANDGRTSFLCSKVIINPKEKMEIKKPAKGKKVNRKTFQEIEKKQLEKMTDGDGAIHINVGGQ